MAVQLTQTQAYFSTWRGWANLFQKRPAFARCVEDFTAPQIEAIFNVNQQELKEWSKAIALSKILNICSKNTAIGCLVHEKATAILGSSAAQIIKEEAKQFEVIERWTVQMSKAYAKEIFAHMFKQMGDQDLVDYFDRNEGDSSIVGLPRESDRYVEWFETMPYERFLRFCPDASFQIIADILSAACSPYILNRSFDKHTMACLRVFGDPQQLERLKGLILIEAHLRLHIDYAAVLRGYKDRIPEKVAHLFREHMAKQFSALVEAQKSIVKNNFPG